MEVGIRRKGIFVGVSSVYAHKKPCLIIRRGNKIDVVASFATDMAADRFALALEEMFGDMKNAR